MMAVRFDGAGTWEPVMFDLEPGTYSVADDGTVYDVICWHCVTGDEYEEIIFVGTKVIIGPVVNMRGVYFLDNGNTDPDGNATFTLQG